MDFFNKIKVRQPIGRYGSIQTVIRTSRRLDSFFLKFFKYSKRKLKNQKPIAAVDDFSKAYPMIPLSCRYNRLDDTFKGTISRDFCFWFFFHESVSVFPQPQSIKLGPFRILAIAGCWGLKVNLRAKMYLKVHFELRISPRIFEKILTGPHDILRGLGETDSWKSRDTVPLNGYERGESRRLTHLCLAMAGMALAPPLWAADLHSDFWVWTQPAWSSRRQQAVSLSWYENKSKSCVQYILLPLNKKIYWSSVRAAV